MKIKLVTDEFNSGIKLFVPVESSLLKFVERAGISVGIIRSEVENGAKKASEDGSKEAIWALAEELSPLIAMEHGFVSYNENLEGMENSEAEVQRQVGTLVKSARNWRNKEKEEYSKADSIAKIRQQITNYCTVQPEINLAPR